MGASPACAGLDWRGMCGTAVAVCSEFACVGGCVGRLAGSAFKSALPYLTEETIAPEDYLLRLGKTAKHIAFIEKGLFRKMK